MCYLIYFIIMYICSTSLSLPSSSLSPLSPSHPLPSQDASVSDIKVQVCVFAFDLLYLNGVSLVREPFRKRRELLKTSFKEIEGVSLYRIT